jgi:glucokinase
LGEIKSLFNDGVQDLGELLAYEIAAAGEPRPKVAALAVAGPVDGDKIALTNRAWSFSISALTKTLALERLFVMNDFAAIAHALPVLGEKDLLRVGGGERQKEATFLACGPGTGFGVSALAERGHLSLVLASEAGHMLLGPTTAEEAEIFARLSGPKPFEIEHLISGPGLARLHRALAGEAWTSDEVINSAKAGSQAALGTVAAFLRIWGRIAGDLALAFDARGGVYLAGGLGRGLAPFFAASPFRQAFEERPTYRARLAAIPTALIVHPSPELVGALALASRG